MSHPVRTENQLMAVWRWVHSIDILLPYCNCLLFCRSHRSIQPRLSNGMVLAEWRLLQSPCSSENIQVPLTMNFDKRDPIPVWYLRDDQLIFPTVATMNREKTMWDRCTLIWEWKSASFPHFHWTWLNRKLCWTKGWQLHSIFNQIVAKEDKIRVFHWRTFNAWSLYLLPSKDSSKQLYYTVMVTDSR